MTHDVSGAHCDGHDLARWRRREGCRGCGCKIGIPWALHGSAWMSTPINCLASIMRRAKGAALFFDAAPVKGTKKG
jgi:hypothetical protein